MHRPSTTSAKSTAPGKAQLGERVRARDRDQQLHDRMPPQTITPLSRKRSSGAVVSAAWKFCTA
jgi:hypothetical protein